MIKIRKKDVYKLYKHYREMMHLAYTIFDDEFYEENFLVYEKFYQRFFEEFIGITNLEVLDCDSIEYALSNMKLKYISMNDREVAANIIINEMFNCNYEDIFKDKFFDDYIYGPLDDFLSSCYYGTELEDLWFDNIIEPSLDKLIALQDFNKRMQMIPTINDKEELKKIYKEVMDKNYIDSWVDFAFTAIENKVKELYDEDKINDAIMLQDILDKPWVEIVFNGIEEDIDMLDII